MLAGMAEADSRAVQRQQSFVMLDGDRGLLGRRRFDGGAAGEGGADLPDEPGPPDRRAADHHRRRARRRRGSGGHRPTSSTSPLATTGIASPTLSLTAGWRPNRRRLCRIAGACGRAPSPPATPSGAARRASSGAFRQECVPAEPHLDGNRHAHRRDGRFDDAARRGRARASAPSRHSRRSRAWPGSPC